MPYIMRLSKQPDTVIIDDGLAPYPMTRAEIEHGIAVLNASKDKIAAEDYTSLMHTYESALRFLKEEAR
jgi:hypothetical protein